MEFNYNRNCFMCCKDCKDRHVGCHSECEKYLNGKKELEEIKKNTEKAYIIHSSDFVGGGVRRKW